MAAAHDSLLQAIELAGARALRSGTNRHPRTPRGPSARGPALEWTGPGGREPATESKDGTAPAGPPASPRHGL